MSRLPQVPDVDASLPEVSGDASAPDASFSADAPSVDVSGKMPDAPSISGDLPSGEVSGKMPDAPSISGDLPSGEISATAPDVSAEGGDGSLTAGLAASGAAALGAIGGAVGLSGNKPDAEVCVRKATHHAIGVCLSFHPQFLADVGSNSWAQKVPPLIAGWGLGGVD